MIGVIKPLVKAADSGRALFLGLALFVLGTLVSAGLVGMVTGGIGSTVATVLPSHAATVVLGALAVTLGVADLRLFRLRTPGIRRQTASYLLRALGPLGWLVWGLDLGLGFSTVRMTSLYWYALAGVLLGFGNIGGGLVVCAWYVAGLCAGVLSVTARSLHEEGYAERAYESLLRVWISGARTLALASGGLLAFIGFLTLGFALAGRQWIL